MKRPFTGAIALLVLSALPLEAGDRVVFFPSLGISEVTDDNLNVSATLPLRDRVRRLSPELELRFESERWTARISGGVDSEQYVTHHAFDDSHARERAAFSLQLRATRRLTISLGSDLMNTNTLADLNADTALAASRIRGRRISATPSASFRLSPTVTLRATASSSTTSMAGDFGMRSQAQSIGLDRRSTPRDILALDYERARLVFSGATSQMIRTDALLASWTHDFTPRDRLILHAGPRRTDGTDSADLAASFTRSWKSASAGLSVMRHQTTVIGYAGAVRADSAQANLALNLSRNFTLFTNPAVFRSTHGELQGLVYRVSGGVRYTLTSFLQAELLYNHDTQDGAIDPVQPNARFSHSTLSIGLRTGRNVRDAAR